MNDFLRQLEIASELETHVGEAGARWRSHQDSPQSSYLAIRLSSYLIDNQEITDNQTYFSVGGRRIASINILAYFLTAQSVILHIIVKLVMSQIVFCAHVGV